MRFDELKGSLKSKIEFCYFIVGKDAFLKDSAVSMITKRSVSNFLELNVSKFNDENYSLNSFLDSLFLMPFGEQKRVVILENINLSLQDSRKITEALKAENQFLCVIFKFDEIPQNLKKLSENSCVVDCLSLDFDVLKVLIQNKFQKNNIKIEPNALKTLIEYCNLDMTFLEQETKKLIAFAYNTHQIKEIDVINLVHKNIEYTVFELSNAVADKDGEKALKLVDLMLENKESPQNLLMMILSNFRRIFYASISKENNKTIAECLGVKEYSIKIAKQLALKFTPKKLKQILDLGGQIDYEIKSSKMEDKNGLYFFVTNILLI